MIKVQKYNIFIKLKESFFNLIFIRPMLTFGAVVITVITAVLFLHKTYVFVIILLLIILCSVYRRNKVYTSLYLVGLILALFSLYNLQNKINYANNLIGSTETVYARVVEIGGKKYLYTDEQPCKLLKPIAKTDELETDTNVRISFEYKDFIMDYNYNIFSKGILYSVVPQKIIYSNKYEFEPLLCKIEKKKTDIINKIYINEKSLHIGTLLGMIFSDRKYIDERDSEILLKTGLYHLLSVSGLHISIAFSLLFFVLRKKKHKKLKLVISILFGVLLFIMSQYSPSTYRAAMLIVFMNLADCFDRKSDSLNTLGLICGIYILVIPLAIIDLSFIMTVFIYMILIIFYSRVNDNLMQIFSVLKNLKNKKWFKNLLGAFSVSVVSYVAVVPFSLFVFNNFSFVGAIVSFLVIPFMPFVLCFGYLGVLFYSVEFCRIGQIFIKVSVLTVEIIIKIARIFYENDTYFINTIYRKNFYFALLFVGIIIFMFFFYIKIKFKSPYTRFIVFILCICINTVFFTYYKVTNSDSIIMANDSRSAIFNIDDNICVIDANNKNDFFNTQRLINTLDREISLFIDGKYKRSKTDFNYLRGVYTVKDDRIYTQNKNLWGNLERYNQYVIDNYILNLVTDNIITITTKDYKFAWIFGEYGENIKEISNILRRLKVDIIITQNTDVLILSNVFKYYNFNGKDIILLKKFD